MVVVGGWLEPQGKILHKHTHIKNNNQPWIEWNELGSIRESKATKNGIKRVRKEKRTI